MRAFGLMLFVATALAAWAPPAVATPRPAWSPVSVSGPTNLSPTASEMQTVHVGATGGTFTLEFGGETTAPLPFNARGDELEAALNVLPSIGGAGGSVAVSTTFTGDGCTGSGTCFVRFGGSLANTDVTEMIANGAGLTGGTVTVSTKTNGGAPGAGEIAIYVQNVGGVPSSGSTTVVDELPAGLTTAETPAGVGWSCLPAGAGQSTVTCASAGSVEPGKTTKPLLVPVRVSAPEPSTVANTVIASGGGASGLATFIEPITVSTIPAAPGFQVFTASANNDDGSEASLAGSHPYAANSAIFVNTRLSPRGSVVPAGDPKTIRVNTPPGFLGDPRATKQCAEALKDSQCGSETVVGFAQPVVETFGKEPFQGKVHNIAAPLGYPAKLLFEAGFGEEIPVIGRVRSDEDYGLAIESPNTPQILSVFGAFFSLWGTPADPSHDTQRGGPPAPEETAFLTVPTACALEQAQPPIASLEFDTWLTAGEFVSTSVPVHKVEDCGHLPPLSPTLAFQPEKHSAATPSAFTVDLHLPQKGLTEPGERAEPALKESVVTLPPGVVVNPSSADGLATCSTQQIGLKGTGFAEPNRIRFTKASPQCPDASKIGTVEVKTPLLANTLEGTLYLASQKDNPFGSLLAVYFVIDDPTTGIVIKLPGKVEPNPTTGQLTTVFDDGPQLPFNDLTLKFKGGERSPLATPDICGKATTTGKFTPWSAPESGASATTKDQFEVSNGPGGACANSKAQRPFHPTFSAGTTGATAGAYAPFEFRVSRADGEQELKGLEFTLPKGLTGKLAGIPYCSDAQIAAARQASGKAEQASPSCPAASQLGNVTSGAGIGGSPIHVSGKLYLAGPYKGAPISAVVITPAVAGPYDLGDVVVRSPLYVDPVTAQLTAKTDSIPDILQGIPLQLRSIKVSVDRSSFILNPTSCERMSIGVRMIGAGGDTVSSSDDGVFGATNPFKVDNCGALGFAPKLTGSLKGGTKRNDNPAFTSVVTYPKGSYSNIASVAVTLPHSEFLDQSHIRTVCTRVQFAADQCPKGAVYGHATATTPLLDQPLSGPVYLRSSENKLPDLVVALKGPATQPIEVDLAGRIDSIKGGIRTTFEAVPDAPVSKFTLFMQGGKKGLLVNSRNLCTAGGGRMTVRMIAQNNKRADQFPPLQNQCGKQRKKHRKGHNRVQLSGIFATW
jgi:hypothetical protein